MCFLGALINFFLRLQPEEMLFPMLLFREKSGEGTSLLQLELLPLLCLWLVAILKFCILLLEAAVRADNLALAAAVPAAFFPAIKRFLLKLTLLRLVRVVRPVQTVDRIVLFLSLRLLAAVEGQTPRTPPEKRVARAAVVLAPTALEVRELPGKATTVVKRRMPQLMAWAVAAEVILPLVSVERPAGMVAREPTFRQH
jgi:hypothetical protein